jgi:hypothetical protein
MDFEPQCGLQIGEAADYEPMTLANMRHFGMTQLGVSCHGPDCWHRADVECRPMPDERNRGRVSAGGSGALIAAAATSTPDRIGSSTPNTIGGNAPNYS